MKRILIILAMLIPVATKAANGPTTTFHAFMLVNEHYVEITSEGPIHLPASIAAAGWNCGLTPEFVTEDARKGYRNIWCQNANASGTIGVTASCLTDRSNTTTSSFFIRNIDSSVELAVSCETIVPPKKGVSL